MTEQNEFRQTYVSKRAPWTCPHCGARGSVVAAHVVDGSPTPRPVGAAALGPVLLLGLPWSLLVAPFAALLGWTIQRFAATRTTSRATNELEALLRAARCYRCGHRDEHAARWAIVPFVARAWAHRSIGSILVVGAIVGCFRAHRIESYLVWAMAAGGLLLFFGPRIPVLDDVVSSEPLEGGADSERHERTTP